MKKTIIILCLSLGTLAGAFAQESKPKIIITAGYGLLTMPQFAEGLSDILSTTVTGGNVRYEDANFTGALILGVKTAGNGKLKLGIDLVNERFKKQVYNNSNNEFMGESRGSYFSIIPRIDYHWYNKSLLRLYSGVGAGIAFASQKFQSNKDNHTFFAFNVVPIGIEIGGNLSVYGETSVGYNGLLNLGLRYKL